MASLLAPQPEMKLSTGYITAGSKQEAKNIAMALVEEGLVACANIINSCESYFAWGNQTQKASEAIIIVKTRVKNEDAVIRLVEEMHSYEVPCVTFMSIDHGSPEFLKWVDQNC